MDYKEISTANARKHCIATHSSFLCFTAVLYVTAITYVTAILYVTATHYVRAILYVTAILCGVSMWRVDWEQEAVEARKQSIAVQAERLLSGSACDVENSLDEAAQNSLLPGEFCRTRLLLVPEHGPTCETA